MNYGGITQHFDVAQIAIYAFWLFFAGLIVYLRREDHREGYPMVADFAGQEVRSFPPLPTPKTFLMADGTTVLAPRPEAPEVFAAAQIQGFPGAPFSPTGNAMIDGVGPASWARRHDEPDRAYDDGLPKIVPLRTTADFFLSEEDSDPRGFTVLGADGAVAGKVVDAWIDRSEYVVRYLEVELSTALTPRRVLLPMHYVKIRAKQALIKVGSITAAQFADVPALRDADTVTLLEEDKLTGYYAGGLMYATPHRSGPLL